MKKLLLIIAVCMLLGLISSVINTSAWADTQRLVPYMQAEVGESVYSLRTGQSFAESEKADACAGSYAVGENGNVYAVDSFQSNSPVKVYKGDRLINTIHAELFTDDEDGISAVAAMGSDLYILTYDSTLFRYNTHTCEKLCIDIPDGILSPSGRGMLAVGRFIAFLSYDKNETPKLYDTASGHFVLSAGILSVKYKDSVCDIRFDGIPYTIPCEEHTIITPLGTDRDNNIIVEYNNNGVSYRKYAQSGELTGYFEETYADQYMYISDIVRVYNGQLYRARCDGSVYAVDIVRFCRYTESMNNGFLFAPCSEEEPESDVLFEEPQVTRNDALDRADAMLNLKWSVMSESNVESIPDKGITVPKTFLGKKLRHAAVGTEYTGIPYCLGGMCGTDNIGEEERQMPFLQLIEAGYTAGNVKYEGKYKSGSAGVDCSGFLSQCYALSEKQQAHWFCESFGHTLGQFSDLRAGDYLVEYDEERHHVMLVCEAPESGTAPILVAESTMYSDNNGIKINGTIQSARPYLYYLRFIPKTAWHTWSRDGDSVSAVCEGCSRTLGFLGDANADGTVNTGDAALELKSCADIEKITYPGWVLGDINFDGKITTYDAKCILFHSATDSWGKG